MFYLGQHKVLVDPTMAYVSKVEISVSNPPWNWTSGPIQVTLVHPQVARLLGIDMPLAHAGLDAAALHIVWQHP